ncbi:hypothetical protein DIPPA_15419 [Diplonema papillatum]|nr:hypothetical protein DIPPA_15419 [Diplonema papillatum]
MGVRLAPALGLVTALVLLVLSEGDFQSLTFGVGTGDPDEVVCVNSCGVLVPDAVTPKGSVLEVHRHHSA